MVSLAEHYSCSSSFNKKVNLFFCMKMEAAPLLMVVDMFGGKVQPKCGRLKNVIVCVATYFALHRPTNVVSCK